MIYVEGIDFELAKFEYLHFAQWIEKYFYIGCEIVPTSENPFDMVHKQPKVLVLIFGSWSTRVFDVAMVNFAPTILGAAN